MRTKKAERAIAVWIFSKIVMLIFLFMTFAIILSYMHMMNERVSADSAEALTMQIKNTVQSLMASEALEAQLVVPLPASLPEPGYSAETGSYGETGKMRSYTLNTYYESGAESYISIALAWGKHDASNAGDFSYAAASWLFIPSTIVEMGDETGLITSNEIYFNSIDHRFFVARKQKGRICLLGCTADLCDGVCET